MFFHDVALIDAARPIARMKPYSRAAVTESLTAAAWRSASSTHVYCDYHYTIGDGQLLFAGRASEVHHIPSSHSPMLSMPIELTDLIVEAGDRSTRMR